MKRRYRSSSFSALRPKTRASDGSSLSHATNRALVSSSELTNHDGWRLVEQVSDTLHTWRDRVRERRELARFTDRELRDVGLTWSDIALEVRKPFWRA